MFEIEFPRQSYCVFSPNKPQIILTMVRQFGRKCYSGMFERLELSGRGGFTVSLL